MKRRQGMAGFALTVLLASGGLSCRHVMPERYIDYNAGRVSVNLPRGLNNAEQDRNIDRPTAAIVSLPNGDEIYVGKERTTTPKDELGRKLNQILQKQTEADKIVFVAANSVNNYGAVVEVLDTIRKQDVFRVGLLGNRTGVNVPSRLAVDIPAAPDRNKDISMLKPNPLTLVVSISPDLKLRLNAEDIGTVNDTAPLAERLRQIFQQRAEQFALRPGFEMRTDLPLEERLEKTLIVKANRSTKYGDVIKIVDALKGAGARPVVLQIDDLSP